MNNIGNLDQKTPEEMEALKKQQSELKKTLDNDLFNENEYRTEIARKYMTSREINIQTPKDMISYFNNSRNSNLHSSVRFASLDKAMELSGELRKKGDEREKKNRAIDVTQKATTAGSSEAFKLENRLYNQYNKRMEEYAKQSLRIQKEANQISRDILKQQHSEIIVGKK